MNYNEFFRFARDFGKYGILDSKKKVWFFRILIIVVIVFCIVRIIVLNSYALTTSTASNTFGTGSSASQLLSLIPEGMTYVIFQDSDSYYCYYGVGSDFNVSGSTISATGVKSIRQRTVQYNTVYTFNDNDNLTLTVNHIICSNLDLQQASRSFTYSSEALEYRMKFALLVFLPILIFSNLKGRAHNEYY